MQNFKNPKFVLKWINNSLLSCPISAIIVNVVSKGGVLVSHNSSPWLSIISIILALVFGFISALFMSSAPKKEFTETSIVLRAIYGVFCFYLFINTTGILKLIFLYCVAECIIIILISKKSAPVKKEKTKGEILLDMVSEGKLEIKNMLNSELHAMCEAAKDYDNLALLDKAFSQTDLLADTHLETLKKTDGIYILEKEKDASERTFTKLRFNGEDVKFPGVIVTSRGVFSLNIIYDAIKLKAESEEMFRVERPNGQPVDPRLYLSEIFERYKLLAGITEYKYSVVNILVALENEDVLEMITFHKMPVVLMGFNNLVEFVKSVSDKTGKYSPEEVKEIYEMINKCVVKEN